MSLELHVVAIKKAIRQLSEIEESVASEWAGLISPFLSNEKIGQTWRRLERDVGEALRTIQCALRICETSNAERWMLKDFPRIAGLQRSFHVRMDRVDCLYDVLLKLVNDTGRE